MTAPKSVTKLTLEAFMDTITGYEEHKIRGAFGKPLMQIGDESVLDALRAATFVYYDREGEADPKDKAFSLTIGDLKTFFAPDDATPEGKTIEAAELGKAT